MAWWRGCCWRRPRWCWLSARALTACPTGGLADRDIADVLNHACDPTRTSQSAAARRRELEDGVAIAMCGTAAEPRPSMPSLLRQVRRVLRCKVNDPPMACSALTAWRLDTDVSGRWARLVTHCLTALGPSVAWVPLRRPTATASMLTSSSRRRAACSPRSAYSSATPSPRWSA